MRHVRVRWLHDFEEEPVLYFSELGDDNYEVRKVQVYRDGRSEWADRSFESATVGLSEIAFPPTRDISSDSAFDAEEITPEEFEKWWTEAREASRE
jgi:hypothetical protein